MARKHLIKSCFYKEKGVQELYGDTGIKRKLLQMKIYEKSMLIKRLNDLKKEIEELEKEIIDSEIWQVKKEILSN